MHPCVQCGKTSVAQFFLNVHLRSKRIDTQWPLPFCSDACREAWWNAPTDDAFYACPFVQAYDYRNAIWIPTRGDPAIPAAFVVTVDDERIEYIATSKDREREVRDMLMARVGALGKKLEFTVRTLESQNVPGFILEPADSERTHALHAHVESAVPTTAQIEIGPERGMMHDQDISLVLFRQHLQRIGDSVLLEFADHEAFAFANAAHINNWWKIAHADDHQLENRPVRCRRTKDSIEFLEPAPESWIVGGE